MWEKIQKFIDRIESRLALYLAIGGSSVMGVITGWLSTGVAWIDQFGAFGWWISGLFGFLLTGLGVMVLAEARYAWVRARTRHKWAQQVDMVNPLDDHFDRKRLNLRDLENPSTRRIQEKQFTRCELRGPANIFFLGGGSIIDTGFYNCDAVVVKEGAWITQAIALEECHIVNCSIWECVIYIPFDRVEQFRAIGSNFISLTGVSEIDNLPPQGTGAGRRP